MYHNLRILMETYNDYLFLNITIITFRDSLQFHYLHVTITTIVQLKVLVLCNRDREKHEKSLPILGRNLFKHTSNITRFFKSLYPLKSKLWKLFEEKFPNFKRSNPRRSQFQNFDWSPFVESWKKCISKI